MDGRRISLRRAAALQREIRAALADLETPAEIRISEFEDPELRLAEAETFWRDSLRRRLALVEALHRIRRAAGEENERCGIDAALCALSEVEMRIRLIEPALAAPARLAPKVLRGTLDKIAARTERPTIYGARDDAVATGVFDETARETFRAEIAALRRRRRTLQDELLALNSAHAIALPAETAATLEAEGLL